MASISKDDQRRMQARALEWRSFRRTFLYSQAQSAEALKISRRCIQNIETQKVVCPRFDIQRKFLALRRRHELERVEFLEQQRRREREAKIEAKRLAALALPSPMRRRYKYNPKNPTHLFRRRPVSLGG